MIILHIREILGGYMKTYVAVYEEGLFDLMGGKTLRGANAPSRPPPPPTLKETLQLALFLWLVVRCVSVTERCMQRWDIVARVTERCMQWTTLCSTVVY